MSGPVGGAPPAFALGQAYARAVRSAGPGREHDGVDVGQQLVDLGPVGAARGGQTAASGVRGETSTRTGRRGAYGLSWSLAMTIGSRPPVAPLARSRWKRLNVYES